MVLERCQIAWSWVQVYALSSLAAASIQSIHFGVICHLDRDTTLPGNDLTSLQHPKHPKLYDKDGQ
jgi:hypothetical protein